MQRSSIYMLAVLLLGATAFAQKKDGSNRVHPANFKYAGIYNYGLGTWTRPGAAETELGPVFSTIYSNTSETGGFSAVYGGEYWTDEGRIPGPNSPDKLFSDSQAGVGAGFVGTLNQCPEGPGSATGSARGSASSYNIAGFQIAYCSQAIGPTETIGLAFFNQSGPLSGGRCAQPLAGAAAPQFAVLLSSFPGAGPTPYGCWIVSINLNAASLTFTMAADGTGDYNTPARSSELDHLFAWTFWFPTDPGPVFTGPLSSIFVSGAGFGLEGAPNNQHVGPNLGVSGTPNTNGWELLNPGPYGAPFATAGYDGTVWDIHGANASPSLYAGGDNGSRGSFTFVATPSIAGAIEDGTGMSTQDCIRVDGNGNPQAAPGNYFFGGPATPATNPFASSHLELYTLDITTGFVASPGTGFCYGDGCGFTCPCTVGTIPDPQGHHESGCANSATASGFGANIGSILTATGSATPFPGTSVVLTCQVDHLPPMQIPFCIGAKGNARNENGTPPPLNDGWRCVDGGVIRFGGHNAGSNGSPAGGWHYPTTAAGETLPLSIRSGCAAGDTAWYQVLHRNAPNSFCFSDPAIGTNWSNGMIIKWGL